MDFNGEIGDIEQDLLKSKQNRSKSKLPGGYFRIYDGDFVDGIEHGIGIEKMYDGSVYAGKFKLGKREGKGKLTKANGQVV